VALPTHKIRWLGDFDGTWTLCVHCRCCEHGREIPARFLIQIFGQRSRLTTVASKLYCSPCRVRKCRCEGKDFETAVRIPR
jgi:hypothetical protein